MEYSKIVAVTGLPGLYELVASKSDGAIVRSLDDKSTRFVSSRIHHFSHLESIEIYTVRENVNLVDILKAIEASEEKMPDDRDLAALGKYFKKVYPDLDFDRVYSSDLKKMAKWFSILKKNKIAIKLSEASQAPAEMDEPQPAPVKEKQVAEKPKSAKKQAPAKEPKPAEKPAGKAAQKDKPKNKPKAAAAEKPAGKAAKKKTAAKKKNTK